MVESCDVFYYNIGYRLGIKRIHSYLSQFGLGKKTDIDLPSESDGLLPNKEWKQKKYSKGWLVGDTLNTSIGQGYMLCTPIQMAQFTAVLASRGKRYKPHLLKAYKEPLAGVIFDIKPEKLPDVSQDNSKAWKIISKALVNVVYGKKGTANKIKPKLDFKIAGKTGTAQVFSFKKGKRIKAADLRKKLKDNAAFVTYAPAKNPQIALAVMLENAEGGSKTAAPIAVDILEKYFNSKKEQEEQNNPEVNDA